jgi:hypothetical protein
MRAGRGVTHYHESFAPRPNPLSQGERESGRARRCLNQTTVDQIVPAQQAFESPRRIYTAPTINSGKEVIQCLIVYRRGRPHT